ncbi:phytoene desaturase family protein [soil metagenome]
MQRSKKVVVIGSGFAGISAACSLAQKGYQVTVLEKNESPGGRASSYRAEGFTFDMGPSWYWMPDVFESFFKRFGSSVAAHYDLKRLDPGYRVFFEGEEQYDIPASTKELSALFESLEPGSSRNLTRFLEEAGEKYDAGINDFVYRPGLSIWEFIDYKLLGKLFKLQLFTSVRKHVYSLFKNDRIRKILEFPVYFLGALPQNTPALYTLMNYADLQLGTWYPMGGMYKIVEGMVSVAESLGVKFIYNQEVKELKIADGNITHAVTANATYQADIVVGAADYHHVEQRLLPQQYQEYNEQYWESRVMAPSSLIFYLGVDRKLENLQHHNLFFDASFEQFGDEIYNQARWPEKPLFYVCAPSVTDSSVAPAGSENLFILIPLAPGMEDNNALRENCYKQVMERLEQLTGQSIAEHVVYKKSFAINDFKDRYNSFKGNAYGLANTLMQTAVFKPSLKSKKVHNLYYTGQLTVPGPGVPPSIISGYVVAEEIGKRG